MSIYFIQAGNSGPVKIGLAENPIDRMIEFQIGHYETLNLLRIIDGGYAVETWLHNHFADLHIRGEWFSFAVTMMTIEPPALADRAQPKNKALCDYLKHRDLTPAEFAEQVGVTAEAVRLWITGGRSPSSTTMRSIMDATEGKVQPNDFFEAA